MKLNKGFWSIGDFFFGVPNFKGDIRYNPEGQSQLLGGLQPLGDLSKYVSNTLKPYKSRAHFVEDLLQPLVALGLVIGGVLWVLAAPIIYAVQATRKALGNENVKVPTAKHVFSWMSQGALSILTGIIKMAISPFNWLLRMPLRVGLALNKKNVEHVFEEKPSIQGLVGAAEGTTLQNTADICLELHRKYERAIAKKLPTAITKKTESKYFNEVNIIQEGVRQLPNAEKCHNYLNLFKVVDTKHTIQDEHVPLLQYSSKGF